MAYNKENLINKVGGRKELKRLIEIECLTYDELRTLFDTPKMSRRVLKNILDICDATIPYPNLTVEARKWEIEWDRIRGKYWESNFISKVLYKRLNNPILNRAGNSERYIIACKYHPRASSANQVKAHIILWELNNKQFLYKGMEVYPIDGNMKNLDITNWLKTTELERKSKYSSGNKNHFYIDGSTIGKGINYTRGWEDKSKRFRESNNFCKNCNKSTSLVAHHIIPYRLFNSTDKNVHNKDNLITLCQSCHGKVHSNKIFIRPLISEMKYEKLLELLETLKSQASDSEMETLLDIEKQLGQTDNQQPSP